MKSYENEILRPAVLLALSGERDVIVHVAPIEHLTTSGRRRSAAELGKGTPDLLLSVKWTHRYELVDGAQWVCFELKAPPCPGSAEVLLLCPQCLKANINSTRHDRCCGHSLREVSRWSAGRVSPEQAETHTAWERGGRWVYVIRTPAEALAAVQEARARLRAAGLEPCAVEGR